MVFYSNATTQSCVSDTDCSINRCARTAQADRIQVQKLVIC